MCLDSGLFFYNCGEEIPSGRNVDGGNCPSKAMPFECAEIRTGKAKLAIWLDFIVARRLKR